jgi:hypothetical protein
MYVCIRMYVYVCMYTYVCIRMYVCICISTYTCIHEYLYIHIYVGPFKNVSTDTRNFIELSHLSVYRKILKRNSNDHQCRGMLSILLCSIVTDFMIFPLLGDDIFGLQRYVFVYVLIMAIVGIHYHFLLQCICMYIIYMDICLWIVEKSDWIML